jgi:predicted AlkP superfamily pyrophosphatase or phosphodiesterase
MRNALSLLLLIAAAGAFDPLQAQPARHVILVSIDGFAAYHLYNQELRLPNIRELIDQGAWFASSETVFPSVTHPSHTTIVTGVEPRVHGVINNSMANRRTGESFHPTNKRRKEIVRVPTIFDAAKAKGLTTAAFFWPETKDDPAIDHNIPEVFTPERKGDITAVSGKWMDELKSAGVPIDLYFRWFGTERHGAGDAVLAEAAAYTIEKYKPGLLAIHILVTDKAQHEYGPHHYLSSAALTMADHCVGILRRAAAKAGIERETAFIVAADHGFHSVHQEINVRPVFERAGLLDKVRLHGGGWAMALELTDRFNAAADQALLDKVFDALRARGIVRRIAGPEDMHALGQPRFEESDYVAGHYLLIPDIDSYLVADPSSASIAPRPRKAAAHGHGYLPQHPRMYPALVLSGAGVKRHAMLPHARNLDIAPTIAHLLGLELKNVSGKILREALAE